MLKRILPTAIAVIVLAALCSRGTAGVASTAPGEAGLDNGTVSASEAGAPIYPGGKPINGGLTKITNYSKPIGTVVTFTTPDSFGDVYKFYKHALPAKTVNTLLNADPHNRLATFKYTKGDGSEIHIEITEYPGHVNYSITDMYKK